MQNSINGLGITGKKLQRSVGVQGQHTDLATDYFINT